MPTMPFCDHARARPWIDMPIDVKADRDTAFGTVLWCDDCSLGFVSPQPTVEQVPEHYKLPRYYTQGARHIPERAPRLRDQ